VHDVLIHPLLLLCILLIIKLVYTNDNEDRSNCQGTVFVDSLNVIEVLLYVWVFYVCLYDTM
jgi:hypothetical protein